MIRGDTILARGLWKPPKLAVTLSAEAGLSMVRAPTAGTSRTPRRGRRGDAALKISLETLLSSPQTGFPRWNPTAAVAAWLLPGLGHWLLGERRRAGILAATIGVLWFAGFIIGGIGIFDWTEHPAWAFGQSLMAPSVVAGLAEGRMRIEADRKWRAADPPVPPVYPPDGPGPAHIVQPPHPLLTPAYEPSYGRVDEQGILYTALAGLLNLLAVVDVLYREADHRRGPNSAAPISNGGTA
jgi:hypothetical protein